MADKKRIVFYSYKGGTGRTLALANIAFYLARFKFKVCIIDMDLEAPGIHYKFLKKTDPRINDMRGVVDYIDYFVNNEMPPPDISPYLIRYDDNISIIPSGNVTSNDYWRKLSRINWHELLYKKNSSGVKLLFDLLGRVQSEQLGFDYILIDARAGITPLSGLCVSLFGDLLAMFFSPSLESLTGTRQMLRNIIETRKIDNLPEIPIISVLTRFEKFKNNAEEDFFIDDKKSFLNDGDNSLCTKICAIHVDREIERDERIIFNVNEDSKGNNVITEKPIRLDYLNFFSCLVDEETMNSRIELLLKNILDSYSLLNEPNKVQSEVEALSAVFKHKLIQGELIKLYRTRNHFTIDKDRVFLEIQNYYNLGGNERFVDEVYFDVFLYHFSNRNLNWHDYHNSILKFDSNIIFRISENATPDKKIQLEKVLLDMSRYYSRLYSDARDLILQKMSKSDKSYLVRFKQLLTNTAEWCDWVDFSKFDEDVFLEFTSKFEDINEIYRSFVFMVNDKNNEDEIDESYESSIIECFYRICDKLSLRLDSTFAPVNTQ